MVKTVKGTGFFVRIIVSQSQQMGQILPSLLNPFLNFIVLRVGAKVSASPNTINCDTLCRYEIMCDL